MGKTSIEWVRNSDGSLGETWNPVTGCTKVSPGCDNCYAERLANGRLKRLYPEGFGKVTLHPERLGQPYHWRTPRRIFVCSTSDLFHHKVPWGFLMRVFQVMVDCPQHTFMVLTKRPGQMVFFMDRFIHPSPWPENVWAGTSVESKKYLPRLDVLNRVPAKVKFVSLEPLLGPVDLSSYIGYNPMYENKEPRERSLRGGTLRSLGDNTRRSDLEGSRTAREQVEPTAQLTHSAAPKGRTRPGSISASAPNDGGTQGILFSASSGMAPFLRSNPHQPTDQSQERVQERQQTGEPGVSYAFSEHETCLQDRAAEGRAWRDESQCEVDKWPSRGNPRTLCSGQPNSSRIGGKVQGIIPSNIEDCSWRQAKAADGSDSGLRAAETAREDYTGSGWKISWCVIGGESGPKARPMQLDWVRQVRDQCQEAGVPFFLKQLGGLRPGGPALLDGREWREMPDA